MGFLTSLRSKRRGTRSFSGASRSSVSAALVAGLRIEELEDRRLLTVINWTGAGDGTSWNHGDNWSGDSVPGQFDDAVIGGTSHTISISGGLFTVNSISSDASVTITPGTQLALFDSSSFSANLTIGDNASLAISGAGTGLSVGGTLSVNGATLSVQAGAHLTVAGLSSYSGSVGTLSVLEATGTGSVLSFPNLATIAEDTTNFRSLLEIRALTGGQVLMPAVTSITGGPVQLEADGTGSVLDVSAAATFSAIPPVLNRSSLQATNHATLALNAAVTSLNHTDLTVDSSTSFPVAQIASLTDGTLTASGKIGGALSFTNLADLTGSSVFVSGGVAAALPGITSYSGAANDTMHLQASGTGSQLTLAHLATIDEPNAFRAVLAIKALAGGNVSLPTLTEVTGGAVQFISDGTLSALGAAAVTTFTGVNGNLNHSALRATAGGTLALNAGLTTLDLIDVTTDSNTALPVDQFTSITRASISVPGGSVTFHNLSTVTSDSFSTSGGGTAVFPAVTTFGDTVGESFWQASGTGSELDFPALATIAETGGPSTTQIKALAGGLVNLPVLGGISGNPVQLTSQGTGSVLAAPSLASFTGNTSQVNRSSITVTGAGTLTVNAVLTSLNYVNLTVDSSAVVPVDQLTTVTNADVTVTQGSVTFANLSNANGAGFLASGGAVAAFPAVTDYDGRVGGSFWQAIGTGSRLWLDNLTSIVTTIAAATQIQAISGGTVDLPHLASISGYPVQLSSQGSGSTLNATALTSFTGTTNLASRSSISVTTAGTLTINPALTSLNNIDLSLDGSATFPVGQLTSVTGAVITVSGGNVYFDRLSNINGDNLFVSGGGLAQLPAVTAYAGDVGETEQFQASGTLSRLALPNLASVTEETTQNSSLLVSALAGGTVSLTALTSTRGTVSLKSDGALSTLDASALASLRAAAGQTHASSLQATSGGTLNLASLKNLELVNVTTDAGSTFTLTALQRYTVAGAFQLSIDTGASGTLVDQGTINLLDTSVLSVGGNLTVDGLGVFTLAPSATLNVRGNLLATTSNADAFNPQGTVMLTSQLGTGNPPQQIEAMSADVGAAQAGFQQNFAYGVLKLAAGTSAQVVDLADNAPGAGAEALYVDALIVPAGATLDLGGLHVYYRGAQINGTVVLDGGSLTQLASAGELALGTPTHAQIGVAGQVQTWTFFGRKDEAISVAFNPGTTGATPALVSQLGYGTVTLLGVANNVLRTATSTDGSIATLSAVTLPVDGVYTIQVTNDVNANIGNYVIGAYDATSHTSPLVVNQPVSGTIQNLYAVDHWTFAAAAGDVVDLHALGSTFGSIQYDLAGPNGAVFQNVTDDSGPIALPAAGNYVLTAHTNGALGGSYSFNLAQTSATTLALGGTYNGTFVGSGQSQLLKVHVPSAQSLHVELADATSSDVNEIYAKLGSPPTRADYTYRYATLSGANQQILIPSAGPGDWYILVYGAQVSGGSYTVTATGTPIHLTSLTPATAAQNTTATMVLAGSGFDPASTVTLIPTGGGSNYTPTVSFDSFTQLAATINLSGVPTGSYSVLVTRPGGASDTLGSSFTVTPPGQAHFVSRVLMPEDFGFATSATFVIEYSNTGSAAMPAPLLLLESAQPANVPFMTLDPNLKVSGAWSDHSTLPVGYSSTIQILASGKVPGILSPGETVQVPVYYPGMEIPFSGLDTFDIRLSEYDQDAVGTFNWGSLESSLQPAGFTAAAWSAVFGSLTATIGNTWGGFVQLLDSEAAYLGRLGQNVTDVNQLWAFAVDQFDGLTTQPQLAGATDLHLATPGNLSLDFSRYYLEPIDSRYQLGSLGYGWSDNWHYSLSSDEGGIVIVTMPLGQQRVFQADTRSGAYFAQAGDHGMLRVGLGGTFTLTEAGGQVEHFNANGTLDYLQDLNGNRITCGYASGKLTSLTSSSGPSLAIAYYPSSSLIHTVTSSDGRTVTYGYDGNSQLTSVQSYDAGLPPVTYSYDTSGLAVKRHALTGIVNSDGTTKSFSYDARGAPAQISLAGAAPVNFTYDLGQVIAATADGGTTRYYFNDRGLLVKTIDPLGNVSLASFDDNFNLVATTNPLGLSQTNTYDGRGNLTSATDVLGQTTSFSYTTAANLLASVTDARGAKTSYTYDAHGNVTSVQAPDYSVTGYPSYDALGDPLSIIDRNRQVTSFNYNAQGQITGQTLADDTHYTFDYDAHGNLWHAIDLGGGPGGATGTITLLYDAGDRLTSVAYGNGESLTYTYVNGRRTQMVDQSGFTTNYDYDAQGRLWHLKDGGGATIVTYSYDSVGRLGQQTLANGSYSTYAYDLSGNLTHLVNFDSTAAVTSRFDYSNYDVLGNPQQMATLDGTWTYQYDARGQLVHAEFASTNLAIPSQGLSYEYDAAGNRTHTSVTVNGNTVTSTSDTGSTSGYTHVTSSDGGDTTYQYDNNGNLIAKTEGGVTTSYGYDSLNRLRSVTTSSDTWIYQYDALGYLSSTTHNGQVTRNLTDPTGLGNLVGQFDSSNNPLAHYTYGLGLVSQVTTGGTNYYQFDGVGSTAALTNAVGAVVNTYNYLPFGGVLYATGAAANPFTFVGRLGVSNDGTGLLNMRTRAYDPQTGHFLSLDPLALQSGDANLYRYVGNSPTVATDSSGLNRSLLDLLGSGNSLHPSPDAGDSGLRFGSGPQNTKSAADDAASSGLNLLGVQFTPDDSGALGALSRLLNFDGTPDSPFATQDVFWNSASPVLMAASKQFERIAPSGKNSSVPPKSQSDRMGLKKPKDPNDKFGPAGFGAQAFVSLDTPFAYHIDFENAPSATAPAQSVTIRDRLDDNLDLSTLQLTEIGFGDTVIHVPTGQQSFQTVVPFTYNGETFDVQIYVNLDIASRTLTWKFFSVDPETDLPPGVLTGFLPPEDGSGRGMGYVEYSLSPLAGLPTGTQIQNVALIVFGGNAAIATDQADEDDPTQGVDPGRQARNTIDSGAPTSSVTALAASYATPTITVNWSGNDDAGGSGIGTYNVLVSIDGGDYVPWQTATTATSAAYTPLAGQHTYAFRSQAVDNVGNVEAAHIAADTTTTAAGSGPLSYTALSASDVTIILAGATFQVVDTAHPATILASYPAAVATAINVTGSSAADVVRVDGSALAAGVPISIVGGGGSDRVDFNDQTNAAVTTYSLSANTVGNGAMTVSLAAVTVLNVNTGSAADAINVLGTSVDSTTTVNLGGANQAVSVGNAGLLDAILGALDVGGYSGAGTLVLDDVNSVAGHTYQFAPSGGATSLARDGGAPITFHDLALLTFSAGAAANTVSFGSPTELLSLGAAASTVNLGPGNTVLNLNLAGAGDLAVVGAASGTPSNTFNVRATGTGVTTLTGGRGSDTFNVGAVDHVLAGIVGTLSIDGGNNQPGSSDLLLIDDSLNDAPNTYSLSSETFTPATGAAPIHYEGIANLTLKTGSGGNTPINNWVAVSSTLASTTTNIVFGGIGEMAYIGYDLDSGEMSTLDAVAGPINVIDDFGLSLVVFGDGGSPGHHLYSLKNSLSDPAILEFQRDSAPKVALSGVGTVALYAGSGGNTIQAGTVGVGGTQLVLGDTNLTINGGSGGDTIDLNVAGTGQLNVSTAGNSSVANSVHVQSVNTGGVAIDGGEGCDSYSLGSADLNFNLDEINFFDIDGGEGNGNTLNIYYHLAANETLVDDNLGHITYSVSGETKLVVNYTRVVVSLHQSGP